MPHHPTSAKEAVRSFPGWMRSESARNPELLIMLGMLIAISLLVSFNINDSTVLKETPLFIGSLFLIAMPLARALRAGEISLSSSRFQVVFAAYLMYCGFSLLRTPNTQLGLEYVSQVACFFVVFTAGCTFRLEDPGERRMIGSTIAVVTLLSCLIAVFQVLPHFRFGILPLSMAQLAVSTFGNTAYFGGFLVLVVPILLGRVVDRNIGQRERAFFLTAVLAALYFIIRTESRSAWIATVAALIVFAWLTYRTRQSRLVAFSLMVCAGICVLLLFPDLVHRRLAQIADVGPSSSLYRRFFFYEGAWRAFLASPLFGHGAGSFAVVLPKYRSPDYWMARSEDVVPHAHNEILEILTETGTVGIVCIIFMIVLFIRHVHANLIASSEQSRPMLVGYICALFAVCVDNLGNLSLRTIPVAFLFWMIAGIVVHGSLRLSSSINTTLPPRSRAMWLLPFLGVGIAVWMYIPHIAARYKAEEAFLQGLTLRAAHKEAESTDKFLVTLRFDPGNAMARLYAASNLARTQRFAEALDHIAIILRDNPYYPKARIVLATAQLALGDTVTARATMRDELLIETSPQATYFAAYIANVSNQETDEANNLQLLLSNAVLSGDTTYVPEALHAYSRFSNDPQRGLSIGTLSHRIAETFWSDEKILIAVAGLLAAAEQFEESERALIRAHQINPGSEVINRNLQFLRQERAQHATRNSGQK